MIVSPQSRDVAILVNIVSTLQQIRPANKPLERVAVPSDTTSISVYVDSGRTSLLGTDGQPFISVSGGRSWYTPSDQMLNGAAGLSTTQCQSTYYMTCQPSATLLMYRNLDNMLFSSVAVASKSDAKFLPAGNVAIIVPKPAKTVDSRGNSDIGMVLLDYELQVRLNVPNWQNLSEQVRMTTYMQNSNMIRLALMQDRYRGGNATLFDADIDGTFVSELTPLESKDVMRGKMRIRSAYWTSPSSY